MTHYKIPRNTSPISDASQFWLAFTLAGIHGNMRYLQEGKMTASRMKIALEGIEESFKSLYSEMEAKSQ